MRARLSFFLFVIVICLAAFVEPARSATIATLPDIGNVTLAAVFDLSRSNLLAIDIRGQALATDGSGTVLLTQIDDPPFGNFIMLGASLPNGSQRVLLDFITSGLLPGGPGIVVPAVGLPLTALSDPTLSGLVGNLVTGFRFGTTVVGTDSVSDVYVLSTIDAVPEPGTWMLVMAGLAACGFRLGCRRGLITSA
jgi:hypothetical protein